MKSSGIGGQAVLEGVMMKNKEKYAIAVRKPDNEITVEVTEYKGINDKYAFFKLPILRGVAAFADSMIVGVKALTFSSSFYEEEDDKDKSEKKKEVKEGKEEKGSDSFFTFITFFLSIVLAVGIFIILPFFLSSLISKKVDSQIVLSLIEGAIRIFLFVGYVVAISQMSDIKRFFQYHGAEHKTINCIEQGYELTVANVRRQSKEHKRCGTSFMLFVMLISIIFFMFIHVETIWLRYVLRILLIPVVAGVSYEVIRLAGRTNNIIVRIISAPGMWMQGLTTKEPDDAMIEVAIQSVEAVFDWKAYLAENKKSAKGKQIATKQNKAIVPVKKSNVVVKKSNVNGNNNKKQSTSTNNKNRSNNSKRNTQTSKNIVKKENYSIDSKASEDVVDELAAVEELSNLDKNLFEQQMLVEEKQNQLKEKVQTRHQELKLSSSEIAASLEPREEEDDLILKALDRYLSFDKENVAK